MFKVVILLIALFLICRLPQWIFVLYKMYSNDVNAQKYWLLHYSLGILILINCMTNPLMYAFLATTIKFGEQLMKGIKYCSHTFAIFHFKGDLKPMETSSSSDGNENKGVYKEKIVSNTI